VRRARALRSRLKHEDAFTLPELLTTLAILGTVLTAITTVFVSGTHAEGDMNNRFQAQQNARLALSKVRRDIRCANFATIDPSGSSLTLTLPTRCKSGQGSITWSTVPLGTNRYGLFRCPSPSACDATGAKWADYLTSDPGTTTAPTVFSLLSATQTTRPRVQVTLRVDRDSSKASGSYTLVDAIALWNGSHA
jgi:prepilin-type N-terminal cleavage/methylation domain-containing protein